jgi:uncharacterized protein (TIGR03067 family)
MTPLIVSLALFAPTAGLPQDKELSDAAKKELKKFEGKWRVSKMIRADGEMEAGPNDPVPVLEFKGRKILADGKEVGEVATLEPSADPKCLDVKTLMRSGEVPEGGTIETIYKFDGDALTLAVYLGEGKKRPANFDAPKEAGTVVIVLKRVKE